MKIKALLYTTKAKPYLVKRNIFAGVEPSYFTLKENVDDSLNGKIVAECDYEVEEITPNNWNAETEYRILKESCLKEHQLFDYIIKGDENEKQKPFYAIHIKNLHIFDEAIKLEKCYNDKFEIINYAPQNMMYSWLYTNKWNRYVLISIQPQWLCKILNGEKTIEVRKKVLKEMLNNE